jgi:hypothetical protein
MGSHRPFGHLKHKLWPKEGSRVKLAIWLPTTKSQKSTDFLMFRWHTTHHWKALDKGYNFALDLISIQGLHAKLWGPKVAQICGSPNFGNFGTPTWESRDKKIIWMWALWVATKYNRKGKVTASPKFRPWWVLWVQVARGLSYHQKCSNNALTNLLLGFV